MDRKPGRSAVFTMAALFFTVVVFGCASNEPAEEASGERSEASEAVSSSSEESTASAGGSGDNELARPSLRHPVQNEQFYFVMPDRFENGDESNDYGGDAQEGGSDEDILRHGYDPTNKAYYHGGDLAGLIDRLDYLEGMGATAVWLTPSFKNKPVQGDGTIDGSSAGYHGYWITDFTRIDPHMGTNEELRQLIEEAHSRNMKVFFDIITNHTADVIDYEEGEYEYRGKDEYPYKGADGEEFDDEDFAGTNEFPELDPDESFAYTPTISEEERDVKVPEWLNDPVYYHNRGDTDFEEEDEDQLYGDFVGLDDLFTEHPDVAEGMVEIYKTWATDYGVDGFRIDTVKHVNMEFWRKFAPEILDAARNSGSENFFMYGEAFSSDKEFVSRYTTEGELQAILDFPFQTAATGFASGGGPTEDLERFFADDDYFTDADSNAYSLPTFLGNHDMGRFAYFITEDNPDADDDELLSRARLGHELMYFARGMPVVYYGDEQGFAGTGGDQLARQNMFPSRTEEYMDEDQIGTDATPADGNFDEDHPLYEKFADLAEVRQEHAALRNGSQIHRHSESGPGIYAFSRIERDEKIEYIVAVNNAEEPKSATFDTFSPDTEFTPIYGEGEAVETDSEGSITVEAPALGAVVYRSEEEIPASEEAPEVEVVSPEDGGSASGRFEVEAELSTGQFAEVTFAVKAGGDESFVPVGTDDNAPYRIFYDAGEPDAEVEIKAVARDLSGNVRSSAPVGVALGGG